MTLIVSLPYKTRTYATITPDKDGISPCTIDWEYMQFVKIEGGISLRGKARSISPLNMAYKPKDFDASKNFPVDVIMDFHTDGMKYREKNESSGQWEDKQLKSVSNFEKFLFAYAEELGLEAQVSCTLNINDCNAQAQVGNYANEEDAVKTMVGSMLVSGVTYPEKQDNPLPEPQEYGGANSRRYPTLKEKLEKLDADTIKLATEKAFAIRSQSGLFDSDVDDPASLKVPMVDVVINLIASL
ncbi:hypothetical protein Lepto7376_3875 [[Leptolyngbya] sp. PCC 7376]|uniref:hypothetical protein n=1 Tax=[Leptolyngbya] sp. PCC 7376 TaxID=111781 RepID=UPI00029F1EED|nr:hypothetical protein [[Leptolyngbya] sp. PCC 7376]AFY40031.1 hypothetical protein Lepto7376_3875 [[Leptolyngbya] sp. PCC 7376]